MGEKNIHEMIKSGRPAKQAEAAAYSEARKAKEETKDNESARNYDINGWMEVRDNPISKVGVFPYSGSQISSDLEPNQIYMVYRPEEELSNPETIDSFKLVPWIDEHEMLGYGEKGLMAPEKKGVYGTIGEDIYFEYPYLKANIKAFSKKLMENDKRDLSIGYRCEYDIQSGTFEGQRYDAIQRNIRGNHIALVKEGRSGPDVSVQDGFVFTLDTKEGIIMPQIETAQKPEMLDSPDEAMKPQEGEMADAETGVPTPTMADVMGAIKDMCDRLDRMEGKKMGDGEFSEAEKFDNYDGSASTGEASTGEAADKEMDMKDNEMKIKDEEMRMKTGEMKKPGSGMDAKVLYRQFAKEAKESDSLAKRLSYHIGTFDHAEMTVDEVAVYGLKKLNIKSPKGQELSTVEGFLVGAKTAATVRSNIGMDTNVKSSQIDAYLQGE